MTPIDFLLNLLVMVLASVISAIILGVLGFFTIKRMVSKAMGSQEVKELLEAFESLKREVANLYEEMKGNRKSQNMIA